MIGIHVVILAIAAQRHAGNHRHGVLLPDGVDPARINGRDFAYETQVMAGGGFLARPEGLAIAAAKSHGRLAHGRQRRHQLLVHVPGQYHHGEVAGLRVSDPQTIYKFAGLSNLGQHPRKGRASAVYYGNLVLIRQLPDGERRPMEQRGVLQGSAAKLDYDFHFSPSSSFQPNIRFMFCTACPAAPFIRLSRQETSTMRLPSLASVNPMSQ